MVGTKRIIIGAIGEGITIPLIPYLANDLIALLATCAAVGVEGIIIADGIVEKATGKPLWYYLSYLHKQSYEWCRDTNADRKMCDRYGVRWLKR